MTRNFANVRRTGFTLVEMLVSAALIVFVMLIITTCFSTGLQSISRLKATGDLQTRLRNAVTMIRRDLSMPHFGEQADSTHGPYLSQQRLDLYDWTPPKEGFFRIWQGSLSNLEGTDSDFVPSYTAENHYLHFTVRLDPARTGSVYNAAFATNRLDDALFPLIDPLSASNSQALGETYVSPDYLRGLSRGSPFYSPWAEVAIFLRESPDKRKAGRTRLFTLYRRQKLLVDRRPISKADTPLQINNAQLLSIRQNTDLSFFPNPPPGEGGIGELNLPSDVTLPFRRWGVRNVANARDVVGIPVSLPRNDPQPAMDRDLVPFFAPPTMAEEAKFPNNEILVERAGDDILLSDVLSFEIKALWDAPTTDARFDPIATQQSLAIGNPRLPGSPTNNYDYPYDNLPVGRNPVFRPNYPNLGPNDIRVFDTWSQVSAPVAGVDFGMVASNFNRPQPQPGWNQGYLNSNLVPDTLNGTQVSVTNATIPLRIRVRALQIRLRVWDAKTQQARQVTIVQDV